jgi:hypothetical protein
MAKDEKKENENGKKKLPDIQITELFMAKRGKKGFDKCFYGVIFREKDDTGKEIAVHGNIYLKDEGMIWSRDVNQVVYGENLDTIVELRLDYGLHNDPGVKAKFGAKDFFHN